jgi:4-amino-4-deoxy-L-arabinose transferase-like glycosyltransferase
MSLSRYRVITASVVRSPWTAAVAAILLRAVVLLLSLHYADVKRHHYHSQGLEALIIAHSLATGHGFSFPVPNYVPTAWVAPVYVWMLALGVLLSPMSGQSVILASQIFNIALSGLTCYFISLLTRRVFGERWTLGAAWCWVILPTGVLLPIAYTWDQSLSAALLVVLLITGYELRNSSRVLHWAGYGLLWGFAALTNPTLCVLLPFFSLWIWFSRFRRGLPSGQLVASAAVVFILALTPWTVRNYSQMGGFTFVKSNFGVEFWLGNNSDVVEIYSPLRHPFANPAEFDQLVSSGELKYSHSKEKEALSFIRTNPGEFLKLSSVRFLDNWTAYYDAKTDLFIQPLGVRKTYVCFCALFSLASFWGLIVALRNNAWESLPLAFCVVLFPIPYYITHTSQRYRHPIDPVLAVLAVVGVANVYTLFCRQQKSPPLPTEERQTPEVIPA